LLGDDSGAQTLSVYHSLLGLDSDLERRVNTHTAFGLVRDLVHNLGLLLQSTHPRNRNDRRLAVARSHLRALEPFSIVRLEKV